ncbi:hypothetical protein SAMN02745824_2555 [Parasphingorhabdus marina DSM 22363]|uniref:Uncharacterized protein n=1 Tax=Parasphingorhabdus marina DSM 22363 TaxID=1123272 RepID=A0A1N6FUX1_9SPHN|nr:hypothetical protein [Parasphingorhabdus marina]SIN99020.1 hypothetical protein SAMN02745824_2555 [Parasphingorhabdus marina DSM 22363]
MLKVIAVVICFVFASAAVANSDDSERPKRINPVLKAANECGIESGFIRAAYESRPDVGIFNVLTPPDGLSEAAARCLIYWNQSRANVLVFDDIRFNRIQEKVGQEFSSGYVFAMASAWLRGARLIEKLEPFDPDATSLADHIVRIEKTCGAEAGQLLRVAPEAGPYNVTLVDLDSSKIPTDESVWQFECAMQSIMLSISKSDEIRFGFLGNEEMNEEDID